MADNGHPPASSEQHPPQHPPPLQTSPTKPIPAGPRSASSVSSMGSPTSLNTKISARHGPPRIMVCLDGSQTSQVALEFASEHLIKPNGVLYILHALPYGRSQSLISFPDEAQIGRDYESLSVQLYERAVETLKSNGLDPNLNNIHIKVEIREGDARQVIMDCCDALAPTTLVVGSRGRSNIKGMLLGSVSAYCLNHATIPVVVVRDPNRRDSYGHLSGEDGSIEAVSDRV